MSDLYLVLRHRLEAVANDWIEIPTEILKGARNQKGWSYEVVARQIPVAAKTWERWEKAGRIPRQFIAKVADLLDLEVEVPALERFHVPTTQDDQARLEDLLGRVIELLEAVLAQQPVPPKRVAGASTRRA